MKQFIRLAIILFSTFILVEEVKASHVMGVDLTYECISPGTYRVRLQVFRDCRGVSVSSTFPVSYSSQQCGVSSSITVSQVGPPQDITPVCPQQPSTACNGSGQYGVQKYIYEGTLNLPPGCGNDWILSWSLCCRNNAITDLTSPGNQSTYIQVCLDNTISPCNNSPVFLNDPTPFYCVNQQVNYNHGVFDVDGDSLVFENICCQQAANQPVNYASGFSCAQPFATTAGGPLTVNPVNGDIRFFPNQTQIGVMAVRINEYRNGQLIGCVVRDMQFTIINCTNQLPTATGFNGGNNYSVTIPACTTACYTINSADADAGQVVTMISNNSIPGSTFTSTGSPYPTGTFCWTTTPNDVGTHSFTITVKDNNCPLIGSNTYAYTINVVPSNDPPVNAGPDVTLCPGQTTTLTATVPSGGPQPTGYQWSDGTNVWNTQTITANPATTTIYTVTASYASGCQKTDAVVVTRIPKPNISVYPTNITLCAGGSVNLLAASTTPNVTYSWTPTTNLSCSNCSNPIATPSNPTTYCVSVIDANNCPSDTVCSQINTAAPPPPQSCAILYATVNGNGNGTRQNPASLQGAINLAQCNNSVIRLGRGTYTLDNPITNITSYTTIEGGFDPVTWEKTSAPGATTIFRTLNNPEGGPSAPRIVAIYLNSQAYFRFQDITFQTADCPNATTGQVAMSNYIFHMTSCSNYEFVRCRMLTGKGGDGAPGVVVGAAGANGSPGTNGSNGANDNSSFNAPGGNGGAGAGAGAGAGSAGGTNGGAGTVGVGSTNPRAGGGGGGGGAGGRAAAGGLGGAGGGVNGGPTASGGNGGTSGDPGGAGAIGTTINGANGAAGAVGSAGSFVGGFFVPGSQGGWGADGEGGRGGGGGGGGGGQNCLFCINGTGNGGGGGGGGGEGGTGGEGGWGGGASIGVYMYNNGNGGIFDNCQIFLGTVGLGGAGAPGGTGGNGGAGGLGASASTGEIGAGGAGGAGGRGGNGGAGGNGFIGSAGLVYVDGGTNPATDLSFDLNQPVINVQETNCTYRNVNFNASASANWNFGTGATPVTATAASANTQYTSFGRKDITYGTNVYKGFYLVPIDANSYIPEIASTAQVYNGDTFIICQGSSATFNAVIPAADTFSWNFGGAVTPNTYLGPNFQTLTNLVFNTTGTFKIRLGISTQCCGWSPFDSAYIIVEPNPTLAFSGLFAMCPGDSVTLTASGSSSYVWAPPTGLNTTTGSTIIAKPAATTSYLVTGYSPLGYCTTDSVITIAVTTPPTLSFTVNPATCGDNGSITVNPSPTGSYSYLWNDAAAQTTQTATNLTAGSYSVTVTDVTSNCSADDGTVIGSGGGLQAFIDSSSFTRCFGSCDGVARVTAIGGSSNRTFAWSSGATTRLATGLCPGPYTVTITDVPSGCTATATVTINQPDLLEVEIVDSTNATCATSPDGNATLNAVGGTWPYAYFWNDPAQQDSTTAVNLLPGTYTVTVVDQNACTATTSVTITSPPATTNLTVAVTDVTCFGGSDGAIDITIVGNAGPYSIQWLSPLNATTEDVSGLPFGYYTVRVIDTLNCAAAGGDSILVNQPPDLLVDTNVLNISCFGQVDGCITTTVSGGAPGYQYLWNDGSTADQLCNVPQGVYALTVTDANNCIKVVDNISIIEPGALSLNPIVTDVSCPGFNDGAINANVVGGTAAFNYTWSNAIGNVNPATQLIPGSYQVTVTDARNCTASATASVIELPGISIAATVYDVLCYPLQNGAVVVSAVSVNPPVAYNWSNGANTSAIYGQAAGDYALTMTDQNGCVVDTAFTILDGSLFTINATPPIDTIELSQSVQLNVSVTAGGNIASVAWHPSNGLSCQECINPIATPLVTTEYNVQIVSDSGCIAWDTVLIVVIPYYDIFIPNVFTPNGDGANDFFEVFGRKETWKQFEIRVFNRWGELVYESTDMNFKWDGRYKGELLNPTVLVYTASIVYLDNYTPKIYKGSLTIMR